MQLFPCPFCGPRDETEFTFATEAGKTEMRDYVQRNNDNCEYSGARSNCHKSFHFADIPIQEDHYDPKFVGAQNYDVVHAINAMIATKASISMAP